MGTLTLSRYAHCMAEKQGPPPGWYVQRGTEETRWWNGQEWTDHALPDSLHVPPPGSSPIVTAVETKAPHQPHPATYPRTYSTPSPRLVGPRPPSDFSDAVADFYRRFVSFSGRSSRAEYWWVYLYMSLAGLSLLMVDFVATAGALSFLWLIGHAVGTAALVVRRFRDAGFAWWLVLLSLVVPFLGLVVCLMESVPGEIPEAP